MRSLTPAEVTDVLETVKDDRLAALYAVTIGAGLRLGEALGLQWSDVEFSEDRSGVLRIAHQLDQRSLELVPVTTAAGRRSVELPPFATRALSRHKSLQIEESRAAADWDTSLFVFVTEHGRPLRRRNVERAWERVRVAAGIVDRVKFHHLRHTYASLLASQGVPQR